jgi:hypothetical protein
MTLHGVGFGLDETAAFESGLAGIVEALDAHERPKTLHTINIAGRNQGRATRMSDASMALFGFNEPEDGLSSPTSTTDKQRLRRMDSVDYRPTRPHAFVAMPFAESFEDVFYYGIARPVREAGLLCERIDQVSFTGNVIDRMRRMIASSRIVIADLSESNPNVYLEVGYAWGVNVPCILICNRKTDLKFDLRGQRCLLYSSIMELEKTLSAELATLSNKILRQVGKRRYSTKGRRIVGGLRSRLARGRPQVSIETVHKHAFNQCSAFGYLRTTCDVLLIRRRQAQRRFYAWISRLGLRGT